LSIDTIAELMQVPTSRPGGEALDQYVCKLGLDEPVLDELTDEQSFRELVESLVRIRSDEQARKSPRFYTPAALGGLENFEYDGSLLSAATHPARGCGAPGGAADPTGDADRLNGIRIIDFSESGVQIQFKCDNPFHLFGSRLFLEIRDARIPVAFKWCRQSQPVCRGGLIFSERINSGRKLAVIIRDLGIHLVDYLLHGFTTKEIPFSEQAGVYAYLAIYYSLRLILLESFAALKEFGTQAGSGNGSSDPGYLRAGLSGHHVESSCSMKNRLTGIFMKPYNDFGCGLLGMGEDVVFPQQDVRAAVLSSMFFTEKQCLDAARFLPAIENIYQRFKELRLLLPGVFEAGEFDVQFKYYNSIMRGVSFLTQKRMLNSEGATFE